MITVSNTPIYLFVLCIFFTIILGSYASHCCKKKGLNPPNAFSGMTMTAFFLFVDKVKKETKDTKLKKLIILYEIFCFLSILSLGLLFLPIS